MSAALIAKMSKMQSWETLGYKLASDYWQANKVLRKTIRRLDRRSDSFGKSNFPARLLCPYGDVFPFTVL